MPPKKKEEFKPFVPIYNAEKPPRLFWEYEKFTVEDRQAFDAYFLNFQKEIAVKMTDSIYANMEFIQTTIGSKLHPLFKQVSKDAEQEKYLANLKSQQPIQNVSEVQKLPSTTKVTIPAPKKEEESKTMKNPSSFAQKKEEPKKAPTEMDIQFTTEEEQKPEPLPYFLLSNNRIDYLTMKLLIASLPTTIISTIKFSNNRFDEETLELFLAFLSTEGGAKIKKVFFEWNDLADLPKRSSLFAQIAKSGTIETLVLRCNILRGDMTTEIAQNLSSNIKFLDLYDNDISVEGFNSIGSMISKNRSLTTLGLAKNKINTIDLLEKILINIGKYPLSEEQLSSYRAQEKERDAIIERNKKLKGKKGVEPEAIPELEPIEQQTEGSKIVRSIINNGYFKRERIFNNRIFSLKNINQKNWNNTLTMLNLSLNLLNEESSDRIEAFLSVVHDSFSLILSTNNFEAKSKDKLKKKFMKKIAF